jgi:hypothetical protein
MAMADYSHIAPSHFFPFAVFIAKYKPMGRIMLANTVKPVKCGHPWGIAKVALFQRWSHFTGLKMRASEERMRMHIHVTVFVVCILYMYNDL